MSNLVAIVLAYLWASARAQRCSIARIAGRGLSRDTLVRHTHVGGGHLRDTAGMRTMGHVVGFDCMFSCSSRVGSASMDASAPGKEHQQYF